MRRPTWESRWGVLLCGWSSPMASSGVMSPPRSSTTKEGGAYHVQALRKPLELFLDVVADGCS